MKMNDDERIPCTTVTYERILGTGKRWFMDEFGRFIVFAVPLAFLVLLILWTATDAIQRGKSPLLVCLLVIPAGTGGMARFQAAY
jgi:hypothetical protein